MLGAIIGDIVGSRFELDQIKTKEFEWLTNDCAVTDDSIMSLAIAKALLDCGQGDLGEGAVFWMRKIGRFYPDCGYGASFRRWLYSDFPQPYHSYGNGAAMRVSACGFAAGSMEEAKALSRRVTAVTHNHPEGLKGAEATVAAIYLAKTGHSKLEIRDYIAAHYYPVHVTLESIRDSYQFNQTCQGTVPPAVVAFLESVSFEDAIRSAISIGGDSDTLGAITGGIAEAYYGIPSALRASALLFLDGRLLPILMDFETRFPPLAERTDRRDIQ